MVEVIIIGLYFIIIILTLETEGETVILSLTPSFYNYNVKIIEYKP